MKNTIEHNWPVEVIRWQFIIGIMYLLLLFTSPIADFLTVYVNNGGSSGIRFSLFVRAVTLAVLLLYIILFMNTSLLGILSLILITLSLASLFYQSVHLYSSNVSPAHILESIIVYSKIFLFFMVLGFLKHFFSSKKFPQIILKSVDIIFLVYALSIISGVVFGLDMFNVYDSGRFGSKGIIDSPNETTAVMLTATMWYILRIRAGEKSPLYLILMFVSCVFLGTKGALIGFLLLMNFAFIALYGLRVAFMLGSLMFIMLTIVLVVSYYSFETVQVILDSSYKYFEWQFYHNSNSNILSLLLANRDDKVIELFNLMFTQSPQSIFLGGHPIGQYSAEMELIDLTAILGAPGALIYLYLWVKSINPRSVKGKTFISAMLLYFTIVWIIIAALAGHMFISAVAAPLLAITVFYAQSFQEKIK